LKEFKKNAPDHSGAFLCFHVSFTYSLKKSAINMRYDISKINDLDYNQLMKPLQDLHDCRICPRNCGADRFSNQLGYCNSDASFYISSICIHRGEEPPISGPVGICNIFFGHCNLQCIYCQNHQISANQNPGAASAMSLQEVLMKVIECLNEGCEGVGFVSPSHFVPQFMIIVKALHAMDIHPLIVYNTNGYDKVETLRMIAPLVDVYLPDFKYIDPDLSQKYSDAYNYPEIVKAALAEMYRQKGSTLLLNSNGVAERGILVRHLVLPGNVENSIVVLRHIAEDVSASLSLSVMSQYHPTPLAGKTNPINRTLYVEEYQEVVDAFHDLGLHNGYLQDMDSFESYRPDFEKNHPFEG
jgi:putative pyruvate formate lyase activating enzyme